MLYQHDQQNRWTEIIHNLWHSTATCETEIPAIIRLHQSPSSPSKQLHQYSSSINAGCGPTTTRPRTSNRIIRQTQPRRDEESPSRTSDLASKHSSIQMACMKVQDRDSTTNPNRNKKGDVLVLVAAAAAELVFWIWTTKSKVWDG